MIFFPFLLFEARLELWSQRFVNKSQSKLSYYWSKRLLKTQVTLTIMILLTAMVWEVEVSDWRCKPATARMFLALSKYKISLNGTRVSKIKELVFMHENPASIPDDVLWLYSFKFTDWKFLVQWIIWNKSQSMKIADRFFKVFYLR